MATIYVGPTSAGAADGTSWANRYGTLNAAEDRPVAANDTVYVGPGTYRELLTVDVSGTAGNPITYIGDYTGANTDGVGGVVRITGSDNDQTATRGNCITATSKNYRTFTNFVFDTTSNNLIIMTSCQNWIIQQCYFGQVTGAVAQLNISGASQLSNTIQNCIFTGGQSTGINVTHSSTLDNIGHIIQNCLIFGMASTRCISFTRVGGNTIKNCVLYGGGNGVRVDTALTAAQTETVNNCLITAQATALQATATGEITENYNTFWANATDRTNTNTGANSLTYPPLLDTRWFFQLVNASNALQVISPFDLASYSALLNVAGTSPTTTDMRGTAVQGSQREWGALEYDSGLKIKGNSARARSSIGI